MERLSANCQEFLELSGYDVKKVKELLKNNPTTFGIEVVSKKRGEMLGIDLRYPYEIYNPYNYSIK